MRNSPLAATILGLFTAVFCLTFFCTCRKEVETSLSVDFSYSVVDSNFSAPARIVFTNHSKGALFYKWTFLGADTVTSDYKDPGFVTFNKPGPIIVKLEGWNDVERKEKILEIIVDTVPKANFKAVPRLNAFAPVDWDFVFTGEGATQFQWSFENGSPEQSTQRNPTQIHYDKPGNYRVSLYIKNMRGKWDTVSKTVTVGPSLTPAFDIVPSFDDADDYEVPFRATLHNKTVGATSHHWATNGGSISGITDSVTQVYITVPGTYTISYTGSNGKQTQTINRTVTVHANSNLRTFQNVKLGINTAHATIGSFFSTRLRRVIPKDSVTATNGPLIDICYFGLSESFSYNRFVSPHDVQQWTFPVISGANSTTFINRQEVCQCGAILSPSAFDAISHGQALDLFSVSNSNSNDSPFDGLSVPRVVLFQNAQGKKGAVKIKQFVSSGSASFILCDIKVQKD